MELRGGPAFATQDLGDATLKTGGGIEATLTARVLPHMKVYGGWDFHMFQMDTPFAGQKFDVDFTGYAFGMQFQHPIISKTEGWVRAGGIFNHIELEDDAGDIVDNSGHKLGWEVGGGFSIPLSSRLSFTPGARYRAYSNDVSAGQGPVAVDLTYVTAEIGIAYTFGPRPAVVAVVR